MQTPPGHGSSRNSGAIIHGKAQGNTANIADMEDEPSTSNIVAGPVTYGYVYLYRSEDRSLLSLEEMEDTSLFFKIKGPPQDLPVVLNLLEKKYPYTKCMS